MGRSYSPLVVPTPRQHPCSYPRFPHRDQQTQLNLLGRDEAGGEKGQPKNQPAKEDLEAWRVRLSINPPQGTGLDCSKKHHPEDLSCSRSAGSPPHGSGQDTVPPHTSISPGQANALPRGASAGGMHPDTPPRPRPTAAAPSQPAPVTREQEKPQESVWTG